MGYFDGGPHGYKPGQKLRRVTGAIAGVRDVGDVVTVVPQKGLAAASSVCYEGRDGKVTWEPASNFEMVTDATFKVGDRVAYSDYKVGGVGVVTALHDDGVFVEVEARHAQSAFYSRDGVAVDFGPCRWFDFKDVKTAPLTIQAGKFYKTRDGRKVGPMEKFSGYENKQWKFLFDGNTYTSCGRYAYDLRNHSNDLIAEWPAEPAQEEKAEPAAIERKFKVGDRVEVVSDLWRDEAPAGSIATVSEILPHGLCARVDGGDGFGWFFDWDDVRHIQSSSPAIVARIDNGKPRPSSSPYVHPDRSSAEQEAARLAGINKGREFGVYEFVSSAKVEPVYEHEWQRLAAGGDVKEAARRLKDAAGIPLQSAKNAVDYWLRVAA